MSEISVKRSETCTHLRQ